MISFAQSEVKCEFIFLTALQGNFMRNLFVTKSQLIVTTSCTISNILRPGDPTARRLG